MRCGVLILVIDIVWLISEWKFDYVGMFRICLFCVVCVEINGFCGFIKIRLRS